MKLQNVVPWGRNLKEYEAMFLLEERDLSKKILGCADGPSSFNKELTEKGVQVISVDPVYAFSKREIQERIDETATSILAQVSETREDFLWDTITSVEALAEIRISAMRIFLEDFEAGKKEQRYLEASLPDLPFAEDSFDLILCSHFLFLYSHHFDLAFHLDSVREMCRVGKEVRIFPLIDLEGRRSPHLDPLIEILQKEGHRCQIQTTLYEFQKGGDEMLRITL